MSKREEKPIPKPPELVPQNNVIRVETALSRYPIHRLARQGITSIEIRDRSEDGETLIKWEVSHNSRYGQPGPLAYKIDTLIVNRRIEEASRPIPKIIKLGTLRDVCHELGISTGENINIVKKALHQNASAYVTAKLRYKLANGGTKEFESGFTRYGVVFTGEELPDGRKADAVYLVLSDLFMQVLNGAQTRPLDYDYLKELPPASQRLYELLSFQLYAAFKNGRRKARLSYTDFCRHAPITCFTEWEQIRPQMSRIHRPHLKSGYIASVEFEQTVEKDGKKDWVMIYDPGKKARDEYRIFTMRGGSRTLEIEPSSVTQQALAFDEPPEQEPEQEPSPLERELIARGISPRMAAQLVERFPAARIESQIERFDWSKAKEPKSIAKSDGGFLAEAIRNDYPMPSGFESKADREQREAAEKLKKQQEREKLQQARAAKQREADLERKAFERWESLSAGERMAVEAAALAATDDDIRRNYEKSPAKFKRPFLERIRQGYLRQVIEHEESDRKKGK